MHAGALKSSTDWKTLIQHLVLQIILLIAEAITLSLEILLDGTPNTKQVWLGQALGPDGVNYGEGYYRLYHRSLSEPFVQDASWIRLRTASLSYSLPSKWLPKKAIRNASIAVTGNNLFLRTDYYGLDPESLSADSGSNVDGSAGMTYPAARTFLFSLNVGF
jgi:hypothetical protein